MSSGRIHRAVSEDGTEIVGSVHGQGPPLVLVHGAVADGDSEWGELVPHLVDRFTCYLPSMRGRGASGSHPDLSREARVCDVVAFVESVGRPVGLVGVSGGGMSVLGAAARLPSLTSVVAFEPPVFEVLPEDTRDRFEDIVEYIAEVLPQGRTADAAGAFLEFIANEEEFAALSDDEALEELAAYVPVDLAEFREALAFAGPSPTDPEVLARIDAPTLLLCGSATAQPWLTEGAHYVAEHVPDAVVSEVPGAGHLGHVVVPDRVATEILTFLGQAHPGG